MRIAFKNIMFNYIENNYYDEYLGQCSMYITPEQYEHSKEYGFICRPCWDFNREDNLWFTYSTDDIITYLENAFYNRKKQVINISYNHEFWLLHDCLHAKECDIFLYNCTKIPEYRERDRLIQTIKECKKRSIKLNEEFLHSIENAHYERYEVRLNFKEYFPRIYPKDYNYYD